MRKHIDNIESVQRNLTKRIIGIKDKDYQERLNLLKIPSVKFRKCRGDHNEIYKICHKLYAIYLFEFVSDQSSTRDHNFKVIKQHVKTNSFLHFFTNCIVNLWNNLPSEIVNLPTMNTFKNRVDKYIKSIIFSTNLTSTSCYTISNYSIINTCVITNIFIFLFHFCIFVQVQSNDLIQ